MQANLMKNKVQQQNKIDQLKNAPLDDKKLKEAADGFEELFVHKMLQVMRNSSSKNSLVNGGRGEEIFQDMLDEQYSKIITRSKALGLSKVIYDSAKK